MAHAQKKSKRTRDLLYPIPKSIPEVAAYTMRMSELLRNIREKESALEAAIENLRKETQEEIEPLKKEILGRAKSVYHYVDRNKETLTEGGKHTTIRALNVASLQWYTPPPSIKIEKDKVDDVLQHLEKLELHQFIRTTKEINKEAMLQDQETTRTIADVSISQVEKFLIKPVGAPERIERDSMSHRWKITVPKSTKASEEA